MLPALPTNILKAGRAFVLSETTHLWTLPARTGNGDELCLSQVQTLRLPRLDLENANRLGGAIHNLGHACKEHRKASRYVGLTDYRTGISCERSHVICWCVACCRLAGIITHASFVPGAAHEQRDNTDRNYRPRRNPARYTRSHEPSGLAPTTTMPATNVSVWFAGESP